jgi:predicted Zn-dependent protease with MMP-like domain
MKSMSNKEFDTLLEEALQNLPPEIAEKLKNVPIFVEDETKDTEEDYDVCGLTVEENGLQQIFIFRKAIFRQCGRRKSQIKKEMTLIHEIGHDEDDLVRLGLTRLTAFIILEQPTLLNSRVLGQSLELALYKELYYFHQEQ